MTAHFADNGTETLINSNSIQPSEKTENLDAQNNIENEKVKSWSRLTRKLTIKSAVNRLNIKENATGKRKKNEDHLGVVFMGIISIFIGTLL